MAYQKILNPGFGIGAAFGTPTTVAVAASSSVTLTGTSYITGPYIITGLVTGVSLVAVSTSNGVTGTWTIVSAASGAGTFVNDNTSYSIASTTTSINVTLIQI